MVTGQTTWSDWSSPGTLRVDRYTFTVTADSPNTNVTITYKGMLISIDAAPHKVTNTVNFVDDAGKTVKTASVLADDQNKPMDISNLIPDGYQLVDSANASLTSGDNGSFFNVSVEVVKTDDNNNGNDGNTTTDNGDNNNSQDGNIPTTPVTPSTPTNPDDSNNHKNDSGTDQTDSPVTNTVEFVDENGKVIGSTTIKVNVIGQKITLNNNDIPAGYKLADDSSLTAKANGSTIRVQVSAITGATDNGGNNNQDGNIPTTPTTPTNPGSSNIDNGSDNGNSSGNSSTDASNGSDISNTVPDTPESSNGSENTNTTDSQAKSSDGNDQSLADVNQNNNANAVTGSSDSSIPSSETSETSGTNNVASADNAEGNGNGSANVRLLTVLITLLVLFLLTLMLLPTTPILILNRGLGMPYLQAAFLKLVIPRILNQLRPLEQSC
ncbi:hypothetical protein [Limosilactobacillus allomucosae]|uniref:hypothetical protein n=1 Tax=Limosilactobacillus allomucosae TaxID=3142938 RepID=UPI003266538A